MHFRVMVTVGKIVLEVELSGQRGHTESGRHDTGGAHRFAAGHRGDTLLRCHLFVSLNLTPFRTEGNVCRVARYAAFPCKRGLIKTVSESYIQ